MLAEGEMVWVARAPLRSSKRIDRGWALHSSDEIGLVGDAGGLAAGHADEDAFVQPVEIGGRRLDLG